MKNKVKPCNTPNNSKNIPALKWVDSRKLKPDFGEEVLLTDCEGNRDLAEYFPGSGWEGKIHTWTGGWGGGHQSGVIFWCRIPEDPEFTTILRKNQQ